MALTAAELRAVLGVEMGTSMRDLGRFDDQLTGISKTASKSTSGFRKMAGGLKGIVTQAAGFATGMFAFQGMAGAVSTLGDAIIGTNAMLEKSTLQFETLMGDADRARKHVEGLFDFAKKTPFETGPIIEASRYLQTFGGDALNTKRTLTMLGDAAAATSSGFDEVAFWTGRMYASLQSGKPVGEALMRFQEMGIISPKARAEIEKLSEAGASSSKIWAVLTKDLDRFGGAMEKQAGTWEGLTSTLADTINLTLAGAFQPLYEGAKRGVEAITGFLSSPAIGEALTNLGETIQGGIDTVTGILGGLAGPFGAAATEAGNGLNTLVTEAQKLQTRLQPVFDTISRVVTGALDGISEWWDANGARVLAGLQTGFAGLQSALSPLGDLFDRILAFFTPESTANIQAAAERLRLMGETLDVEPRSPFEQMLDGLVGKVQDVDSSLGDLIGKLNVDWGTAWGDAGTSVSGFMGAFEIAMASVGPTITLAVGAAQVALAPFLVIWKVAENVAGAFVRFVEDILPDVQSAVGDMVDGVASIFNGDWAGALISAFSFADTSVQSISKVWTWLQESFDGILSGISDAISDTWNGIDAALTEVLGGISDGMLQHWKNLKGTVSNGVDWVTGLIEDGVDAIIGIWNSLDFAIPPFDFSWGAWSIPIPSEVPKEVKEALFGSDIHSLDIIGAGSIHLWDGTGDLIPDIGTGRGSRGRSWGSARPLATGTLSVPGDMVAYLHKGESVIPRPFAEGLREALRGRAETEREPARRIGTIEHIHRIDAASADALRGAGFDVDRLADLLRSAARESGKRYRWAS